MVLHDHIYRQIYDQTYDIESCTIVSKLLGYHVRDQIEFPVFRSNHQSSKFPNFRASNLVSSVFHPSKIVKQVRVIAGLTNGSPTMRLASFNQHWWYDCQLIT